MLEPCETATEWKMNLANWYHYEDNIFLCHLIKLNPLLSAVMTGLKAFVFWFIFSASEKCFRKSISKRIFMRRVITSILKTMRKMQGEKKCINQSVAGLWNQLFLSFSTYLNGSSVHYSLALNAIKWCKNPSLDKRKYERATY